MAKRLFDGPNGTAAVIYAKENLLQNVLSVIPPELNRDEWVAALPRALVAGFVKTDKDFQERAQTSGTTVTFVIIEGWVVTVASVGDSTTYVHMFCVSATIDMQLGNFRHSVREVPLLTRYFIVMATSNFIR
ncbi:putative protein phosphatase 2C 12 [Nicotiana tabacum]|uniref:Uncharacterized protein n=1 Tax=Nicotiana tabacum TaxID=4097 RepID=A0AC58SS31_TOBAC